ncbi:MAG: helicase RepA family protein [Coriobacteriia bacterium]|nr:helicase RepA family protein [Coriobacteriia bacterium]
MDKEAIEWANQPLETYKPDIEILPFRKAIIRKDRLPQRAPELVAGLLRQGATLLLQGAAKMAKSFALIALAIALATGIRWLGFQCRKSKVLYINLEIHPASFDWRVFEVAQALGADMQAVEDNLTIWNARGENLTIEDIREKFDLWELDGTFDAIIIDPLYKVQAGDENTTESINRFFNVIEAIAKETGASIIMCHHHSKGSQRHKQSIERSSGSGTFGRAPDTIIDFTEFPRDKAIDELKQKVSAMREATALLMSFTVRDFKSPEDFGVWFEYPIHKCDTTGLLSSAAFRKEYSAEYASAAQAEVDEAITRLLEGKEYVLRTEIADALGGKDRKTIDKYVENSSLFESETVNNNSVQIRRIKTG